jgi:iron complex transport system ATP-binding protein
MIALTTRGVEIRVGTRTLVRNLNLSIEPGALVAILGPNGVGKTLTLHTMAALRLPAAGSLEIGGTPVTEFARPEFARQVGLLLQSAEDPFPTTVREAALLGCFAQLKPWERENAQHLQRAEQCLELMNLNSAADRPASSLSGGERRRLGIATLLVQDPAVMLLDEPLNHLDPLHEMSVLQLLGELADSGKTVIASLHDPMLAARSFDYALLLHGDGRWAFGPVEDMLTTRRLAELYGVPFAEFRLEGRLRERLLAPSWPSRERRDGLQPFPRSA